MRLSAITNLILIIITSYISYRGFQHPIIINKFKFEVGGILDYREYYRLISAGFVHINFVHLLFNMITLYAFGTILESVHGKTIFIIIYFASLIGGNILALLIHRNHTYYSAVGASGAISGVVFASIFLFPGGSIVVFPLPMPIPATLYAILYTFGSIYGIKSQRDNIGHEAHLGGSITGMLIVLIAYPLAVKKNALLFIGILISVIIFLIYYIKKDSYKVL